MKKLIALCALLALFVSCAPSMETMASSDSVQPNSLAQSESAPAPPPPPQPKIVKFSATGDNLIHDGLYSQAKRRAGGEGYDFNLLYENVEGYYDNFDVNFINQETLITDVCEPSSYPTFCSPEALGFHMVDIGFNVFATSNNHSYDKGAKGIQGALDFYKKLPENIISLGFYNEDAFEIAVQEVNGIKIAYLAYSQYTNGIPLPQNAPARVILTSEEDLIKQQIEQAKTIADFVVVGVHWGNEDTHNATDGQKALGMKMADWGADVIVGTHPHVVQPIEWYDSVDGRKTLIIYSLGNFVSAQSKAANLIGMSVGFDIVLNPDEVHPHIENAAATPIITHYDSNYGNIRAYLLKDYTEELANKHGVRVNNSAFSMDFIKTTLTNSISEEFLILN